jgi:hypothetical protein
VIDIQKFDGNIVSGEFDQTGNVFLLQTIKNFYTETSLKEKQIQSLHAYLNKHQNEEEQILSLFDQMLVRLSQDEVKTLLGDLENISTLYD